MATVPKKRMNTQYAKAAQALRKAHKPIVLSGAGLSAESGIPTFRGADGLWKNYRAEDLATVTAFEQNPELVWEWYNMRREIILKSRPNPAHYAIKQLFDLLPNVTVITQNVDDLQREAGLTDFIEMHGNIFTERCTACKYRQKDRAIFPYGKICPNCGSSLRPHIIWFGEPISRENSDRILEAVSQCDVMLVVGTSGTVYPAAGYAIEVRRKEGQIIEINPDETHKPFARDIHFKEMAGCALPRLLSEI